MGVEIVEATAERVVATMPVEGNTQPYGLLHGGASAVLAETIGSIGAMLHGGPGKIAVGVDLNCTHHRGLRSGKVTGVATPVHRGRSSATYEIVISDEQDRRVCSARLTCMLRPATPGTVAPDDLPYGAARATHGTRHARHARPARGERLPECSGSRSPRRMTRRTAPDVRPRPHRDRRHARAGRTAGRRRRPP